MAYDMFNTAVSGLLSYQKALSTTSHNIANVGTEGYSKQRANFGVRSPDFIGGRYIGNGVQINSITRSYDQFLTSEVRDTTSSYEKNRLTQELAGYVDNVLADPFGGISPVLQEFFAATNDVADDPTSTTSRNNLINVSQTMSERFHNIDTRFDELEANTSKDIKSVVTEINDIVEGIAEANLGLNKVGPDATSSQQSSDLLDQRDQLILELSKKIDITVINEDTSSLSIFIGNGQTILSGLTPYKLEAVPNASDPSQDSITYKGLNTVTDLSDSLKFGGELGALLEFRDSVLTDARNDLGRVAIAISESFNEQHRAGLDLNNNQGSNFFSVNSPLVLTNSGNAGTTSSADISVAISDVSQLTRFDYDLRYDGANWNLTSTNGTSAAPVAGANANIPTFEGLDIQITGGVPVAGDSFRIRPTIQGAGSIQTLVSDPLLIAAASAIRTDTSLNNLGTTSISQGVVTDGSNPALLTSLPLDITFNSATTFRTTIPVVANGVAVPANTDINFTNNMTIAANGWEVNLTGVPQTGDVVTVDVNTDGQGDNRNALLLANLQNKETMDGGYSNYQEAYSALVGRVGTVTAAAESQRDAQHSLLIQSQERKDSKTAVNLDEEAADLIRYQQAYQATSQIISTVQTLFDTLLNATR